MKFMEYMKAVICTKYGAPDVLRLTKVLKPKPKKDEVCIKIYTTGVTASDMFIRSSQVPLWMMIPMRLKIGILKPRKEILGSVFSGVIESVGDEIKRFKVGDEVYGMPGYTFGTYAEYLCLKETDSSKGCIALKPKNITHEEATAAAYGGLLALQQVEKSNLQKGQEILIYGASGTSGTLAIQIAKHIGAKVTTVCGNTNVEMVKKLGADETIDYTKQHTIPKGVTYDLVLDSVGKFKKSKLKSACKKALKRNGQYLSIDDEALQLDSKRLERITSLIEANYIKPVMDKIYPLEEIVGAHHYVETGHKKGGVAATVANT
jgi:NADPH:quinone reductase-like Zn-dependent oxidoreductase